MTKSTSGPAALSAASATLSAALGADTLVAGAGSDTSSEAKTPPLGAATEEAKIAPIGAATTEAVTVLLADESQPTKPYLTTRPSDEFGGQGSWADLTDAQFAAAPDGLLKTPTADQLALRLA